MAPAPHFSFGIDHQHGFVAVASADIPEHLAHWYLTREQFEPVPNEPGLYRLTEPEHNARNRAAHAVLDLQHHGYTVSAELYPPFTDQPRTQSPAQRRARVAQAAGRPSPQRGRAPATTPTTVQRPVPPNPHYPPTVHPARSGRAQ